MIATDNTNIKLKHKLDIAAILIETLPCDFKFATAK